MPAATPALTIAATWVAPAYHGCKYLLGLAQPSGEDLVVLALVVGVLHEALVEALGQLLGLLGALLLLARLVCCLLPLLALL